MKEKVKGLGGKLKDFFAKMGKKSRVLLGVVLTAIVVGAVIIALILNNGPYAVLFTGLTGEEARSIMSYLDENGISDYRMEGSDTILVPKNQEEQMKAKLLMQGYPKSGFAYETYRSAVGTMSTESDRNRAYLQDLQDRMAAVIRCMDGVKDAVVNISEGEDRRYILNQDNMVEASASVMVTMQSGAKLSNQVADAIRTLVARAVKGLTIDNIAISDSLGNLYSGGDMLTGAADASELKLYLEEQVNNSVRTQVMEVLIPLFGTENVRVGVNSTVDVRRSVGESTKYTEPDWASDGSTGGAGIIGSKIWDQEILRGDGGNVGGVAGTESNSDLNTYMENSANVNGDEDYLKNSGQIDYNVDTEKEQVERVAGTVADLMVSVSINQVAVAGTNTADLMSHVARAAGIGTDLQREKISILVAPFYTNPDITQPVLPEGPILPHWAIYAAIGGGALLLLLLLLIASIRRKGKKKKSSQLSALLENAIYAPDMGAKPAMAGADIMNIRTEKSMELRKDIRQFAEENPEIAAQMVRSWLKGGEDKDG